MTGTGGTSQLEPTLDTPLAAPEEPRRERLHPLSLVAGLGAVIKQAWAALAGAIFFISQGRWEIGILLVAASTLGTLGAIAVRLFSFSYRVEEDEIDIASGVLNRTQRSIPFDRVQDVNIEQNPLARLVGLARVKLETGASAGAKDEDGVLDSITLERAAALRDRIRSHRAGLARPVTTAGVDLPAVEEQASSPVFTMDSRRLLLFSMFSFSLAIVGALFGIMQTYGDALGIDPFDADWWQSNFERIGWLERLVMANQAFTVLLGLATLFLTGMVTGLIRVFPRDWGFRLERTETGFRRRRGLFTLTDVVLPLKRVQAAIIRTGPLRSRLGYSGLSIQSLARDSGAGGDHAIAPFATGPEVGRVMDAMDWPQLPPVDDSWDRPSRAFIASYLLVAAVPVTLFGLLLSGLRRARGDAGLADLLAEPLPWIMAGLALAAVALGTLALFRIFDWRHRRHRLHEGRLLIRRGWWQRKLIVLPLDRIQSIDLTRNVFQRWFGIADLRFGVAGGSGFAAHAVDALPEHEARTLRDALLEPVT
ncbi:PH domain-containing protein [Sphingomicrobium aestuariivivum]|uniref:PH domain-containing protein n=1 Tax=Sphingomicrobium aestuariivivum TaxID=1582356 RepID=UPI001FD700DF|nr:PH domain-containing protein [Sphingomicrobium aestuariivivum]MCJ8191502.1 PH domain-containing protein [Sphingomicrobium aestuariivivum]